MEFGVGNLGSGVWGLGFGVWGLGLGVGGLGVWVWGLGFGVYVSGRNVQVGKVDVFTPMPARDLRATQREREREKIFIDDQLVHHRDGLEDRPSHWCLNPVVPVAFYLPLGLGRTG